jgi:hypothetical protein
MDLDINKIYDNFIIKIVIFALFLHKSKRIKEPDLYIKEVTDFVSKKIGKGKQNGGFRMYINPGKPISIVQKRNHKILNVLKNIEMSGDSPDYIEDIGGHKGGINMVEVRLTTPLRTVDMFIDLDDEERYEKFLRL